MRQLVLLVSAVIVLAGSAATSLPARRTQPASNPPRERSTAAFESEGDEAGPTTIAWVGLAERTDAGIHVRASITAAGSPVAVLRRGDAEVARTSLTRSGLEWHGELDAAPGDYQLTVADGSAPPQTIDVMARTVTCLGAERRLVAREVFPGTLVRVGAEHSLVVPRWYALDQEYSFIVEWLRDGKLAYEVNGHTAHLQRRLGALEGTTERETMCSHAFGETYTAPELAAGSWEVRVHREGAASVVARFEVTSGQREIALPFAAMEDPGRSAARVARVPACPHRTLIRDVATGETSGYPGGCGAASHSNTGAAVPATAAEYRALMRDPEIWAIRTKMHDMLLEKAPLDRPDFEYDPDQSPDANWHRRRAWEKRDTERQFAGERILAARARSKYRAPLLARVKRSGGRWTPDEIPAPMAGWPAR